MKTMKLTLILNVEATGCVSREIVREFVDTFCAGQQRTAGSECVLDYDRKAAELDWDYSLSINL